MLNNFIPRTIMNFSILVKKKKEEEEEEILSPGMIKK